MDLSSRLRAIVKGGPPKPMRELTYEPDIGGYEAVMDLSRVGAILGGQPAETPFGQCLVIDRRYEADRFHGAIRIGECEVEDFASLAILDPVAGVRGVRPRLQCTDHRHESASRRTGVRPRHWLAVFGVQTPDARLRTRRTIFIDLETTGLSGGAGTVAFLVGCGYFDLGAFQVRQFLLTSFAAERALLAAVADFFDGADLIVTYNGKTFDVPVMETRWLFHRLQMPLDEVPHFDMLHPARRLWRTRGGAAGDVEGCRLTTLERALFNVTRVGDVPGLEIPARFFRFVRSGDPRPLEPVLEHNRLDLVSLAAVMARAAAARARRPGRVPRQRRSARARPGVRTRRDGRSDAGTRGPPLRAPKRATRGRRDRARPRSKGKPSTGSRCGTGASAASKRPRRFGGR